MGLIFTIGYSGRDIEQFIRALEECRVDVVCDVRSTPYSRYRPDFSRRELKAHLNAAGMKYKFFGEELGARPKDRSCYENGQATYERIAKAAFFRAGLERVRNGSAKLNLALVCSEADPLECHRAVLVCRHLNDIRDRIQHVLEAGSIETHDMFEERLVRHHNLTPLPLLPDERDWIAAVEEAYERQAKGIAFREQSWPTEEPAL